MTCPKCRKPVPDKLLGCIACLERQSRADYLDMQRRYLPDVLAGRLELITAGRGTQQFNIHLVLFNDENHTWCWEPIRTGGFKRKREPYSDQLTKRLCSKCRAVLEDLVLEPCQETTD